MNNSHYRTLTSAAIIVFLISSADSWMADFYMDRDWNGKKFSGKSESCLNFNKDFNDEISSVDPKGSCLRMYEHRDCIGHVLEVYPSSWYQHTLQHIGFNDKASSAGPCRND